MTNLFLNQQDHWDNYQQKRIDRGTKPANWDSSDPFSGTQLQFLEFCPLSLW
jgi:hypothetical protein